MLKSYCEGSSQDQIAETLGVTQSTIAVGLDEVRHEIGYVFEQVYSARLSDEGMPHRLGGSNTPEPDIVILDENDDPKEVISLKCYITARNRRGTTIGRSEIAKSELELKEQGIPLFIVDPYHNLPRGKLRVEDYLGSYTLDKNKVGVSWSMKESNYWECVLIVAIAVLGTLMFRSMQLGLVDMVVQWLGILLAFILALTFSESAKIESEERRAESITEDLVVELREMQETLKQEPKNALFYSATWSYIKASGLPDRIPRHLRKALADAFLMLDMANDSVRMLQSYSFMPNTDQNRFRKMENMHQEHLKTLGKDITIALDLYDSMKKRRFSIRRNGG